MTILKSLRISVPLLIVIALLLYTWTNIIVGNSMATWQHYPGLAGFLVIIIALLFSYRNTTTIAIGVYLILGTISGEMVFQWVSPVVSFFHCSMRA